MEYVTEFGTAIWFADMETVKVEGSAYELDSWAHRPGASWPCSVLAGLDSICVVFDRNGLVDIDVDEDEELSSDELSAWTSDVLEAARLPESHPAYLVTVGQFREGR